MFHKYGGDFAVVANFLYHFSMFVPTIANMKFSYINTRDAQLI